MTAALSFPLELGSTGNAVSRVQQFLAALNLYSGRIDGDFGSMTKAAVLKFQKANGLSQDGIVGENTGIVTELV